jgi:uncharacterized membrane protein
MLNKYITIFLSSMVPVIELRGGIPLGIALGVHPITSALISILGSTLVMPIIFFTIRPILNYFLSMNVFKHRLERFIDKTLRKSENVKKYGFFGLTIFVGIPLPGTGAWTGTLIAALLDMRFKRAFLSIFLGNVMAAVIMLLLTTSAVKSIELLF